ncbi:MAG: hypothetical protein CSA62_14675 [Planctomycetota bacterium]|nr:MAG: hypothetical protein CSA62_14675 [Planctomycetota bacterium]
MTLRSRLLLAIFLVNLVVLGALSVLLYSRNQRSLEEAAERFAETRQEFLKDFAGRYRGDTLSVEAMLEFRSFQRLFRDVLLADFSGVAASELVGTSQTRHAYVQINPLGAACRDPRTFPKEEILAGIQKAMDTEQVVPSAGGFCLPITRGDGRLVGGGWFLPPGAVTVERLPIDQLLIAIGLGVLLMGGVTFIGMDRWVLRPLADLSRAAGELERSEPAQVQRRRHGPQEFDRVFAAFNHASRLIQEHRAELERAVEDATKRAKRRERELILSQRLAALGTLAAGIAHEINNPLAGLLNASNRLRKSKDPERQLVYLELIEDGLERIRQIVSRTLDFAPRSTQAIEFVLADSVRRAEQLIGHRLRRAGVRLLVAGEQSSVRGDAHEMTQVFLNLLINSLDALEEAKTPDPEISVSIREIEEEGEELIEALVRDNGPGADEDTLSHVFDPFYSTKGATAKSNSLSSGLGMAISYTIIEQHGGRMSVHSTVGEGFEVRILLPASLLGEVAE